MSNDVITVGSATSTGGKVVSGNSGMMINHKPIALVGDMATCACPNILVCRRQGEIVAMSPRNANVNGTLFAKAGDLVDTGCGSCFLLPSEHGVSLGADVRCSLNVGSGISFGNGVNINQSGSMLSKGAVMAPPPSSFINNVASKKVFAKSPIVPFGTVDVGTQREQATSIGSVGVYAAGSMDAVAGGGLATAALSRVAGVALADMAGFAMQVVGRSGVLLALAPTQMGDGTLYGDEEIRQLSGIETRIRFGFDEYGNIQGYHVDNAVIPKREVNRVGAKFVAELEPGITIEWVPISEDIAGTKILVNPIPDVDSHTIFVHPEAEQGEEFDNTYITPISEADLNDYILIFPEETGLPPLYIVYSKPPVKLLEVDLYGNFKRRPRNGTHADHMPSQAAATAYLKRKLSSFFDDKDAKKQMDFVATLIIPAEVHRKYSETYGGRNTPMQIDKDSRNLRKAVDNNFMAIKNWMLDEGFSEIELEEAKAKMHQLNKDNGWYK